ncbi:MAG: ATP-dependent sacrificial sulfur transferase LarE [Lachnospiraceae bacterium]|jgi:uncharacterized protein|nr:ATP-dependent sacrificial sulfur transferase LarE [Lachnospiraceae bacterium]MCH4028762.1 ATP-dependent sacrificial sulfur transferase LarE [Lachnospiraceae bacterium]MCH4066611.1 ATP-dependent sacrificial sulfur transferase LarE [Lachnospiraceae bacterium]MCH4112642.1 ATP-dependent sacrificial sulfur transferase LarE [Lachnospiraceae bacterium]
MTEELKTKYENLKSYLFLLRSVAVAYSGGVDSTLLLKVAHDVLGDAAVAMVGHSEFYPKREGNEAADFCRKEGIRQIDVLIDVLKIDGVSHNPKDRCYICKHALFSRLLELAAENDIAYVAEGSNLDDEGDYRPGLKAIAELKILSPLRAAGFTKADVRALSKELGLPTWSKPSYACLASRFVYGETLNDEKLHMVDAAEQQLIDLGIVEERVRIHGDGNYIARIEVLPEDFENVIKNREIIVSRLKELGFRYVTLDLKGYRTGAMNEVLSADELSKGKSSILD